MTKLTVAALQLAFTEDTVANIRAVADLVREAAGKGASDVYSIAAATAVVSGRRGNERRGRLFMLIRSK